MKVQMVVQISGSRDGVDWPKPGETFDVDEVEANELFARGYAREPLVVEPQIETATAPQAEVRKGLTKDSLS